MAATVLVVAKQVRNGALLRELLAQVGYQVILVSSWEAWQSALLQARVNLALVDVTGLGRELERGYALLREAGVPFLVVVPRWSAQVEALALHHGARGVLVKPLDTARLLRLLQSLLPSAAPASVQDGHANSEGVALLDGRRRMERVAVLLESSENARLLREWLEPRFEVVSGFPDEVLAAARFDVGLLDTRTLMQYAERIQELRHQVAPLFLPFVLLTPRHDLQVAAHHLWQTIDDLILTPVEKVELQARVEIALRARRFSMELHCRYRRLFEHVPIGLYRADAEGRLLDANPTMRAMLRLAPDQALEALPPASWFADPADFAGLLKDLDTVPYVQGREIRLRALDGELFWGRVALQALRDSTGHLVSLEGAIENADEVIRAREERERWLQIMADESRRIQQILATVPEGVLLFEQNGTILLTNAQARAMLPELAGIQGNVGDVLDRLGDHTLSDILTSPPLRGLWHEVKCGSKVYEMLARPVEGLEESDAQWVLVIKDVTQESEIRQRIQQQERLAAVGQLAAGIAHDFNNIMAVITLYAQMLERSPNLEPRQRENVITIANQAGHATRLIQQILDFSRRSILERRPFDLLPFLKEQVKLLKRTLPETIQIVLDFRDEEYRINGDPTSLQQMIMNLAVNARDAMPEGGTLLLKVEKIVVKKGEAPDLKDFPEIGVGEWIRLTVRDTGTGIAPEVLPHIFEPFFTTKPAGKGSGLGLAQVHGIVAQHDGHITLETEPGKGTAFYIYFPALDISPVVNHAELTELHTGHGEWILLVEDNEVVRTALTCTLEQLNYQVMSAVEGEAALRILADHDAHISLLITDVVMPGMGGVALVRHLRKRGWRKPIVMLTGHAMDENLEALRREGLIENCLTKPVVLQELADVLSALL